MVEPPPTWAPLVISAIGAFGGGALVGALGNHLLRLFSERQQEQRERDSLLLMVLAEIVSNNTLAQRWAASLEEALSLGEGIADQSAPLKTDVWKDARTRLAYLLPSEDFYRLVRYYHSVHRWESMSGRHALDYFRGTLSIRSEMASRRIGEEYLRDDFATGFVREYQAAVEQRAGRG